MTAVGANYETGMAMAVETNPLGPVTIVNGKYGRLNYADLGSAVIANYSMTSYVDNVNPTENKYGAYSLTDPSYAKIHTHVCN